MTYVDQFRDQAHPTVTPAQEDHEAFLRNLSDAAWLLRSAGHLTGAEAVSEAIQRLR